MESECKVVRGDASRAFLVSLALFVIAPGVVVFVGFEKGNPVFFLYREPKLVAMTVLGWALLTIAAWTLASRIDLDRLRCVIGTPQVLVLGSLVIYLGITARWALVPANSIYELQQYLLLLLVLIVLLYWNRRDARVEPLVRWGLVGSVGVLTVVGLGQMVGAVGFLRPIDPSDLVGYPSLMGYKNPMAMVVLGQVFVLAGSLQNVRKRWPLWASSILGALLAWELVYLVLLQSRASLFGLGAGAVVLLALFVVRRPTGRRLFLGVMSAFCLLLVIIAIASFSSKVERKVRSATSFIVNPISYFESDRGTYLLNTLNMAGHRPFGVGIGDWQTQYPVYRLHNRNLWFNEDFQVRRAHSDHVQMLGEAGWPGIFLWAAFLTTLLAKCVRLWWAAGHRRSLFYAAQIVAMAAAMSVDYVIEHPFCKHQFFLFAFLILSTDANAGAGIARRKTRIRPIGVVFAVLVTCAAAANLAYSFGLAKKIVVSGHLTREYLSAVRLRDDPGRGEGKVGASSTALQFDRVIELGNRLNELTGHTKSMYRDHLLVADSLRRLGRSVEAKVALQMSLQLHPHHPPAFREMSVLASDSEWRDSWNSGYRFLMDEATKGYDRAYPPGHPLRIPH